MTSLNRDNREIAGSGVCYAVRAEAIYRDELVNCVTGRILVTRVEAGSNTSTVTLRVVGGDKKGKSQI
jgi:hypothetical protein